MERWDENLQIIKKIVKELPINCYLHGLREIASG
jgi:hypothetical protein